MKSLLRQTESQRRLSRSDESFLPSQSAELRLDSVLEFVQLPLSKIRICNRFVFLSPKKLCVSRTADSVFR